MKQKSQETISMLNPHAIYLNVIRSLFLIVIIEKEAISRLDQWSRRVSSDSLFNYPPLRANDGLIYLPTI